jgi:SAM-dependent methyltransferase
MAAPALKKWELAEVERSAAEASHIDLTHLLVNETQAARYLDPPAETAYPLEYSYFLLGDVRDKTVLEYGCGDGLNTVMLAMRGARVKALDISPELVKVAEQRITANQLSPTVDFIVGSAHDLPLPDNSVDVVFGIAILHHLDLVLSSREVKRVLRMGGRAIFQEPVRNSAMLKFVRKLIPYQTPDLSPFERTLTDAELESYADGFSSYRSKAFTLPSSNLINLLPPLRERFCHDSYNWDKAILKKFPALAYYSTVRVIEMVK